jgi:hypothetical protein
VFESPEAATIILLPAVIGALFAIALSLLMPGSRGRASAIGLGLSPFALLIVLIIFFQIYSRNSETFPDIDISHRLKIFTIVIVPNYALAFTVAVIALLASFRKNVAEKYGLKILVVFLAIHLLGLSWAFALLSHKGSF